MKSRRALTAIAALTALGLTASACSTVGEESTDSSGDKSVVLATHDSFVLPKALRQKFEKESGYDLVVRANGVADRVVLGQDELVGEGAGVSDYALHGDTQHRLTPVDNGNVCVNVDDTWFAAHHLAPPKNLTDLTDPAYKDLFVLPGAATSSTGMAFLLATIAAYGDGWKSYWTKLMDNGAELTSGWEDAYEVDFTQGGGKGDRPIVLSYDSSPAFTVPKGSKTSTTSALLDTCFEQVEYVGVLSGAANVAGAEAFVRFMDSPEVQAALPESMYVFPDARGVKLPTQWAKFAVQPTHPYAVDPADIAAHRDEWLRDWSDITSR